MTAGAVTDGAPEPLGATLTETGLNIAVWSAHATAIELCLYDETGQFEQARIPLTGRTGPVFHGHVEGVGKGARYGLRAHGPFDPAKGHRFNPDKLLVDPYALALDRPFDLHPSMSGGESDSGPHVPKAVATTLGADWPAPPNLSVPWGVSVIYELHVRGFTKTHPDIPDDIRGTFAGLAHPVAIDHLKRLGVTTVELMPCAAWIDERHLGPLGLTNYWGYNPVAFMVPDPRLAPGGWREVRAAVGALADAGIETLVDVVFNHTGEGDALGSTVSLRGLDNASYYRLTPDDAADYVNDAGTGNTLAMEQPAALRLTMDALRAWRRLGGVAGFRFDLATTLARRADGFDPHAPILAAIDQDPELRGLKLIAEPWDIGPGGYQLGGFPAHWGEWNDRFRDDLRGFWRGDGFSLGVLARRLSGSQDVFDGRPPSRGVNFITAHDGFTLADLVSYETKHNLANGEGDRDGVNDNRSWNGGVEGPTDDPAIQAGRLGDQRTLLASLLLARGTPMLSMGAEMGQSQGGNNNAYAQDNATSWLNWAAADPELLDFATRLITLRREHVALRADRFLTGEIGPAHYPDVDWRRADGGALSPADWDAPSGATLVKIVAELDGADLDRVMVVAHRAHVAVEVVIPSPREGFAWTLQADSADPARTGELGRDLLPVSPRSIVVLTETPATGARAASGTDAGVLSHLARAAGVAADWWSVDGARHPVSPDTEKALLAAMRLPAGTTAEALDSLHRLAEDHDRRALPPALVKRHGEPVEIPLAFGPGEPPPHTWLTVEGEDGRTIRLRATLEAGVETSVRARDGRTGRQLVVTTPPLAKGRYQVRREDRPDTLCHLTIAPHACFAANAIRTGRRVFGLTAQLYALRRDGDQGIGDFTTLSEFGEAVALKGAAILGINPLHALFGDRRERASPYYPSDRRFLDPIYLDLDEVSRDLAVAPAIDYPAVWALKAEALEARFAAFGDDADFTAFIAQGGDALARFAAFQAIAEVRPGEPWQAWPDTLRNPDTALGQADPKRARFHQYLQWLCEQQLAGAARRAGGLELGFCRDLAVGSAPDGAEAWAQADQMARGVSIGAPPDPLGPEGQVWGLPPYDPHCSRVDGYRDIASLYAANMRYAGALRIDHVMGLSRQFWVPDGADGKQGAYVDFPLEDLLGHLALESERAHCLVIGEDLGTVPPGLRERLNEARALSYRVLTFERDGETFRPPTACPVLAWSCVATHDLPPLAGWWDAVDVSERLSLGLITPAQADEARAGRLDDRKHLVAALAAQGLVDEALDPAAPLTPQLAAAIHAYVARTPAVLALAQAEDLAGEHEAVNLPGTDQERPNWRRRVATPIETLLETPGATLILDAMRAERG